jgi:tetratricopeptide (TPR) repeat protein
MIMKQLTIALLVMLLSGCTMERTNRTLTQYGNDQPELLSVGEESVEATAEISLETIEKRKQLADLAKKNHGLMHIHRYGPGFDVLMTLDAGDSDVIFSMKLPLASGEDRETLHSSAEDIVEKNKQVLASLDDEKSELHHEELNERSELIEQKKIQDFQASTKHIFSAQSLFYKKQYWQSLDETNKALELVPSSAQAHALKGSIYYKMGLSEEAKTSWQQALALDPTMEHVKTSLTRLK